MAALYQNVPTGVLQNPSNPGLADIIKLAFGNANAPGPFGSGVPNLSQGIKDLTGAQALANMGQDRDQSAAAYGLEKMLYGLHPMGAVNDLGDAAGTYGADVIQPAVSGAVEPLVERAKVVASGGSVNDLDALGAKERQRAQEQQRSSQDQNAQAQNFAASLGAGLMGDSESSPIELGAVPMYDAPNLPLPGPDTKADYTEARSILEQLRPEAVDNTDLENTRGMAVLAGMAAGLVNADHNSMGSMLLQMGIGSMAGHASIDAAELTAKEKFKESMKEYLGLSLKVAQAQHETDADYASRVYDVSIKQAMLNYQHAQSMAEMGKPRLTQLDNGNFAIQTYDPMTGKYEVKVQQVAEGQQVAKIHKQLVGMGMDHKTAVTVAGQAVAGGDPKTILPVTAVGMLHTFGQIDTFLEEVGKSSEQGKKFQDKYYSIGVQGMASPTADKSQLEKEATASKDLFLRQMLMNNPHMLYRAMQLGNFDPRAIAELGARLGIKDGR